MTQTYLVLGSRGTIGSRLFHSLESSGAQVIGTTRQSFDHLSLNEIERYFKNQRDLIVVNCVGLLPDLADANINESYKINYLIVKRLWQVLKDLPNIYFIHLSTSLVFDGRKNGVYLESDKTGPLNIYGLHKESAEKYLIQNLEQKNMVIYRMGSLVLESPNSSTTLGKMLSTIASRQDLQLITGRKISLCSIKMLTNAILSEDFQNQIVHISHHGWTSWEEVIIYIRDIIKLDIRMNFVSHDFSSNSWNGAHRPQNSSLGTSLKIDSDLPSWQSLIFPSVAYLQKLLDTKE